jgi:RHS repeat-associated protein
MARSHELNRTLVIHGESFPDPLYMIRRIEAGGVLEDFYYYYLKDALGSVLALSDLNSNVVERYAYTPYGQTLVLDAEGQPWTGKAIDAGSTWFYHDHDSDGDLDNADLDDFFACYGSRTVHCVFHHDRDGDSYVGFVDWILMGTQWPPNAGPGVTPPPHLGRPAPTRFDANTDNRLDLYDGYGMQVCYDQTDALCLLIYDANTNGTVDLADMNAFAAAMNGPEALDTEPAGYPSRYENPFAWTGQRYDYNTQLYHFWARTFDPATAKWNQRDMLGGLASVNMYLRGSGQAPIATPPQVFPDGEYASGLNLFLYVSANPVGLIDPLGLYEDETTALIDVLTGHKIATLGYINEGARIALVGTEYAASIAGSLLGLDLIDSFKNIYEGNGGFWDYLDAGLTLAPGLGAAGKLAIKAGRKAFTWGRHMHKMNRARGAGRYNHSLTDMVQQAACFTSETPVAMANGEFIEIDQIRLGDRVLTAPDPIIAHRDRELYLSDADHSHVNVLDWGGDLFKSCPTSFLQDWREIRLVAELSDSRTCEVALLRPVEWLSRNGAIAGKTMDLNIPEIGITGPAFVASISLPELTEVEYNAYERPITGIFATTSTRVLRLYFEGIGGVVDSTPGHLFWSLDRSTWVPAGNLQPNESVRTLSGPVKLERVSLDPALHTVYNMEVQGTHTYFVSRIGFWVHNACPLGRKSTGRTNPSNLTEQLAMEQAMSNVHDGRVILDRINDPVWPEEGWVKMTQHINGVEVHYLLNQLTGAVDDFKFK